MAWHCYLCCWVHSCTVVYPSLPPVGTGGSCASGRPSSSNWCRWWPLMAPPDADGVMLWWSFLLVHRGLWLLLSMLPGHQGRHSISDTSGQVLGSLFSLSLRCFQAGALSLFILVHSVTPCSNRYIFFIFHIPFHVLGAACYFFSFVENIWLLSQ